MNKGKYKLSLCILLLLSLIIVTTAGCAKTKTTETQTDEPVSEEAAVESSAIDYMALVNKESRLPDGWEEALETTSITNSVGDEVVIEKSAYEAYLKLKDELAKEGIQTELDSAYRSVEEQQKIVKDFTEKYGEDYVKKYVAVPGYSEHHTGLALDLYLIVDDKTIYENEDLVQYPEIWEKIHEKCSDYGFILRYLQGKADITGYSYEPWHLRYIKSEDTAKEIMDKGITFEEYLGKIPSTAAKIDYGKSDLYSQEEMDVAITEFKKEFENWDGCELHNVKYTGDKCNSEENIKWLNELAAANPEKLSGGYTQVIEFTSDFHSPTEEDQLKDTAWEKDKEYTDYQWWLGRKDGGAWELVSSGY